MCREQDIVAWGYVVTATTEIFRRRERRVRREGPVVRRLHRFDCKLETFACAVRRAHIDQFRKPPRANRRTDLRNQLGKRSKIRDGRCSESFGLSETFVD